MKSIALTGLIALTSILSAFQVSADVNAAYLCSFCLVALGLVEQSAFQIHLENALIAKCGDSKLCQRAVKELTLSLTANVVPEDLCSEMKMCTQNCPLFDQWPVNPLPPKPIEWPILRRKLASESTSVTPKPSTSDDILKENIPRDLSTLKSIFEALLIGNSVLPESWGPWAHIAMGLGELDFLIKAAQGITVPQVGTNSEPCGFNITCKIEHLANHKPFQDHDGDYFASDFSRRLRGNDWRGTDCDDRRDDVYPGRRASKHNAEIDHNCNGIYGSNATATYEELFCAGTPQRGLVILGDSATAHFHVPPQWITAQGWTMDQILVDAENELDQPHCSWGTGHVVPEDCPYQHAIPGIDGVLSLYTQLRQRNRCNHNDFQNIGVNGARITSSMQLVDAMARDPANDHPLLVYLALIGNDVCNGHPGYDHMTDPDDFYVHAMETLNKLDTIVPSGSHVVSVALFDGELLYQTMHNKQHPIGAKYSSLYDFMNCLEENPCWGWLNSNATARRITTQHSNSLNRVYQNISETQTFKNFEFIYFSPKWTDIFDDYLATGQPLSDLIEPADGFHPSQTGNALFAKYFFNFLEKEHPEALGPVNPHNDEIDAMFFSGMKGHGIRKSQV